MRVLVLGAAGSAADNYVKCIRGEHWVLGADVNEALLPLSCAHETAVLSTLPADGGAHEWEIRDLVAKWDIDVIHAAPDQEALFLSQRRRSIGARSLITIPGVIKRCQDKLLCSVALGNLAPLSGSWLEWDLDSSMPAWLRLRTGAGSAGAVLAEDREFCSNWIAHWGWNPTHWMLSEYLPGPDRSWTAVYRNGKLVARGMRERVQYMNAARSATGQTSTYQVGRLIHDDALDALCQEAVSRVDMYPHGWYYVDTKGHEDGRQLVTEINAGRPNTTVNAWAEAGLNLPLIALNSAAWVGDYVDGTYLRQPDMGFKFIPDEKPRLPGPRYIQCENQRPHARHRYLDMDAYCFGRATAGGIELM